MKKLTRKLFLSVASLGVCAATLVSTTFAWYTTNTSVDLGAISGMTETQSASNQLYIAAATGYDPLTKAATGFGSYGVSATPTPTVNTGITLKPVYSNNGQYQAISKTKANYEYKKVDSIYTGGFTEYKYVQPIKDEADFNTRKANLVDSNGDPANSYDPSVTYYVKTSTYYITSVSSEDGYVAVSDKTVDQSKDYYVISKGANTLLGKPKNEYTLAPTTIYGRFPISTDGDAFNNYQQYGWYVKNAPTYTEVDGNTAWNPNDVYVVKGDTESQDARYWYDPVAAANANSTPYYTLNVAAVGGFNVASYVEATKWAPNTPYYKLTGGTHGQASATYELVTQFKGCFANGYAVSSSAVDKYGNVKTDAITSSTTNTPTVHIKTESYSKAATFVKNTDYYKINDIGTDTIEYATEISSNILEYVLRFKTTSEHPGATMPIYVSSISLTNVGFSGSAQTALANGGSTGITNTGAYNVDLLKALKMDVYVTPVSNANGDANTNAMVRYNDYETYGFEAFATNGDVNIGTANAVGYYNAVTRSNIDAPAASEYSSGTELRTAAASSNQAKSLFSIPATSNYVEVRFVFYLDGWDAHCYDVCRKQGFRLALSFSTTAAENVLF